MITREKRKLLGSVRSVEAEFAVFEITDGNAKEIRHQPAGYELYDLEGKLIEEISPYRLMMEDSYKDIYFYDEHGKLYQREEYDENEILNGKTIFEQYNDGNRIEKNYYFDNQGNLIIGSHSIYDSEDKHIETSHYDANGNIDPIHIYEASSKPVRKVEENTISNDDEYITESFHYDEEGKLHHRTVTSYDPNGNKKEFSGYELDGTLYQKTKYDYEFDLVGNWTKRLQYWWVSGWGKFRLIPWTVTRRKIDYY